MIHKIFPMQFNEVTYSLMGVAMEVLKKRGLPSGSLLVGTMTV